jgi:uncharacterized protein YegL
MNTDKYRTRTLAGVQRGLGRYHDNLPLVSFPEGGCSMPITIKKKAGSTKAARPAVDEEATPPTQPCESGLDPSNRTTRTPFGWVLDGSPSLEGFTAVQLRSAEVMVEDLRRLPATGRSILMNMVQLGTPPSATGFVEIEKFRVPALEVVTTTPLHLALDRMTQDFGRLFADIRQCGLERTESVVIFTTDGLANGCTADVLTASIDAFTKLCKRWSVSSLVFGVGNQLNVPLLKRLANSVPPLRIDQLKAELLMPFVQRLAERVSQSRPGQTLELDLPDEMTPIE